MATGKRRREEAQRKTKSRVRLDSDKAPPTEWSALCVTQEYQCPPKKYHHHRRSGYKEQKLGIQSDTFTQSLQLGSAKAAQLPTVKKRQSLGSNEFFFFLQFLAIL